MEIANKTAIVIVVNGIRVCSSGIVFLLFFVSAFALEKRRGEKNQKKKSEAVKVVIVIILG